MTQEHIFEFKKCIARCWLEPSDKIKDLSGYLHQSIVRSASFVFFRIFENSDRSFKIMTATAGEDRGGFNKFPKQQILIEATKHIVAELGGSVGAKIDRSERDYVEFSGKGSREEITEFLDHILNLVEKQAALDKV